MIVFEVTAAPGKADIEELTKVQARDKVVDFTPIVLGLARTATVHDPPATRFDVPQLSDAIEKFVVSDNTGAEQPEAVSMPEFVKVKILLAE